MGGFGGAVKNIPTGLASSQGKSWIHAGKPFRGILSDQDAFLEPMAELRCR